MPQNKPRQNPNIPKGKYQYWQDNPSMDMLLIHIDRRADVLESSKEKVPK